MTVKEIVRRISIIDERQKCRYCHSSMKMGITNGILEYRCRHCSALLIKDRHTGECFWSKPKTGGADSNGQ